MSDLVSSIEFKESRLINLSFDASPSLESFDSVPDMSKATYNIDVNRGYAFREESGSLLCDCTIRMKWKIYVGGEGESDPPLAAKAECGMVAMSGAPSIAREPIEDAQLARDVLVANTISFIWGKMRDWIELVSLSSPLGKLSLPAIDPYALVSKDE